MLLAVRVPLLLVVLAIALGASRPGRAHEGATAYLSLEVDGSVLRGELDLSARDARGLISPGGALDDAQLLRELDGQRTVLERRIEHALSFRGGDALCPVAATAMPQAASAEAGLIRVSLEVSCPSAFERLEVRCSLLRPGALPERLFLALKAGPETHAAVLTAQQQSASLVLQPTTALGQLVPYFGEGVRHVLGGFDHLLFLAALLLPVALVRERGGWRPRESMRSALLEIAWVVSAFTLAHSLTLCASALALLRLPPRLVESAIALSVLLAALANLGAGWRVRGWQLALGLGLVHGLGFAAGLEVLGLKPAARAVALLGFNLGVEAGQLAAVAAFLPLLTLRRSRHYRTFALEAPSSMIAWLAGIWLFERALGVRLLG